MKNTQYAAIHAIFAAAKTSKVGLIIDESVAVCKTACAASGLDGVGAVGMWTK